MASEVSAPAAKAGAPFGLAERKHAHWERQVHATLGLLAKAGLVSTDELRRAVEGLEARDDASKWGYYGTWSLAIASILRDKGVLALKDLEAEVGKEEEEEGDPPVLFAAGQEVHVRDEGFVTRWRRPHLRTPGYLFGQRGVVERVVGSFPNPERRSYNEEGPKQPLYRVRFRQHELFPSALLKFNAADTIDVEVYQCWLQVSEADEGPERKKARVDPALLLVPPRAPADAPAAHGHGHGHAHAHDHGHEHETRAQVEQTAVDREGEGERGQAYGEALVRLLIKKDLVTADAVRRAVEGVDAMGQSGEGARVVVRAWTDAAFKAKLLEDANGACGELGIDAVNSCYPAKLLGLSPDWYKSRSYRARAVQDPRALLASEFGFALPDSTLLRVHDSTADCRYLVVPRRPDGTEGWSEARLRALVTRDSMIGVSEALSPSDV